MKGGACLPTDIQLCYKSCGPENTGVKSETCTAGVYAEMAGCTFDPSRSYSCYKIPATSSTACGAAVPRDGTSCAVPHCTICNSTGGLPGGHYTDSGGADQMGYCVCPEPNASGTTRTWSCTSETEWPCPAGRGC
jgi:hypothetical protein